MKKYLFLVILFASTVAFAKPTTTPAPINDNDYFVARKIPLDLATEGLDGYLELLQDKTFKTWKDPSRRQEAIDAGWDQLENPPDNYKIALLRLVSKDGKTLETIRLDKYFANEAIWIGLQVDDLYGTDRTSYLVEQDYEIGNGTGQGAYTRYFEVVNGYLVCLSSKDNSSSKKEMIDLRDNMEDIWKALPNPKGKGKVLCQRRADPYAETTAYIRYEFDGKNWIRYERIDKGSQDSEWEFPKVQKFY